MHEIYMKRALTLAHRGHTSPNPMVGAIIVQNDEIVSETWHKMAGEPHAEALAIKKAGKLAADADLYVTLEPCCHHGKTPPCTDAIIKSGIRRVFAAMEDPNPLVAGNGIRQLREAGIEVQVGLLETKARQLNEGFIKRMTTGLPFVLWKTAMTLDGKIATKTGDSRWVTGEQARKEVHRLRNWSDAVMVGIGTILADDPELTVRGIRGSKNPTRIIIDSHARTPADAHALSKDAPTIIATLRNIPEDMMDALSTAGAKILRIPDSNGRIDLRNLMGELGKMEINNIILECGGELAASMLEEKLIDRGLIFIAPKIIGGEKAKTPVEGEGIELMAQALNVTKPKIRRFGDDLALEFEIRKTS